MEFDTRKIRKEIDVLIDGEDLYHFPLQREGPTTWANLHKESHGTNPEDNTPLIQQTFPQAIRLVSVALDNRNDPRFAPVIEGRYSYVVTGDTLALWTPQGLYGVDHPEEKLITQLRRDDQKTLREIQRDLDKRLSGASGEKVVTSEDKYVRFTKEDITYGSQDREVFGANAGLIVLAGNEENASALSDSSKVYKLNPGFYGLGKIDKSTVTVPDVGSDGFGGRLNVYGSGWGVNDLRVSFGVSKNLAKPSALENR